MLSLQEGKTNYSLWGGHFFPSEESNWEKIEELFLTPTKVIQKSFFHQIQKNLLILRKRNSKLVHKFVCVKFWEVLKKSSGIFFYFCLLVGHILSTELDVRVPVNQHFCFITIILVRIILICII